MCDVCSKCISNTNATIFVLRSDDVILLYARDCRDDQTRAQTLFRSAYIYCRELLLVRVHIYVNGIGT